MSSKSKKLWAAIMICGAGTLFQVIPNGCANYLTQQALVGFDFCSVFNCTGGTFFNFCEPIALFMDCPNLFASE
ncbi:MAG TPA: hypothetical protein PLP66_13165 [Phycisphaerae bacterium]|jgi:hypothetical protein|nr:hypothetical protein [Phycisphaerae bacterium]HPM24852.1 hypothetical protein [Phycisphaerae bacterium]